MTNKRRKQLRAASRKYNAKTYDALTIRVRRDGSDGFTLDDLRHAAEQDGESLNAYIVKLISDNI